MNNNQFYTVSAVFWIVSFGFLTMLPSFVISKIVAKNKKLPKWWRYPLFICLFSLIGVIFWEVFIFNNLYFEWDRTLIPFSLIYHESPVLVEGIKTGSWIRNGWTQLGLDSIWLAMVFLVYLLAKIVSECFCKTKDEWVYLAKVFWILMGLTIFLTVFFRVLERLTP